MADGFNQERVEQLASALMKVLVPTLAQYPPSRDHVLVALNALAFATATILAGVDRNGRRFFEKALADNIAEVRRAERTGAIRRGPDPGHA